jgi:hypothetical protein
MLQFREVNESPAMLTQGDLHDHWDFGTLLSRGS